MNECVKLSKEDIKKYKFIKVMFDNISSVGDKYEYKIDEVNIANEWNPTNADPEVMHGFNITTSNSVIRWLNKGDTLYDVIIPEDAEVYDCWCPTTPEVVFRTNKIIVTNKRNIDDSVATEFYECSNLKDELYPKAMIGCVKRGYMNTAHRILKERINKSNIDFAIEEYESSFKEYDNNAKEIYNELLNIKNN